MQYHADTAAGRTTRLLRLAGWLQISLAVVLGGALALTWRTLLAGPRHLGTAVEATLGSADRSLAATEVALRTNQPRLEEAGKAIQGYARFSASVARTTEQSIPLLRAWGEDSRGLGDDVEAMGAAIERFGLAPPIRAAGEKVRLRGERLRASGGKMLDIAASLEKDGLPAIRQTAETLRGLECSDLATSSRQVIESVARTRETVRQGIGMVSPTLLVLRLTCGVFAAMALVLLLCGVTTVLLGRALADAGLGDRG